MCCFLFLYLKGAGIIERILLNQTIKKLRVEHGLTQKQLAKALGVTEQAISKWENETCCPDVSLIIPIAKYFSVSIDTLFGYDNQSKNDISQGNGEI